MVKALRVRAADDALLDSASRMWNDLPPAELTLEPTPITAQPSSYVQAKWSEEAYGLVRRLVVRAAHDGERIYFHLTWPDDVKDDAIHDTDRFADAAAVLFPVHGDAPLQSMGSPQKPVNAWYWRPDMEEPLSVTAQGTGTTRRTQDPQLRAQGLHTQGEWSVVIRRALASSGEDYVTLAPGTRGDVGFAVWQGANQERGGLKAVTPDWEPLEIEA